MLATSWRYSLRHSLKTRITLSALAIFLLSLWSLSFYIADVIHTSLEKQVMDQQASIATLVGVEINDEINERMLALHRVASVLAAPHAHHTPQEQLAQMPEFLAFFSGGVFVTDIRGVAIASLPVSVERIGVSFAERDYFQQAVQEGRSIVGKPVIGKKLNVPVVGMATPLRDARGAVVGVLVGIVNLEASSFLDKLVSNRYGETGGYLVVSRAARMVVAATDKTRVMTHAAKPGLSPLVDQFMAGVDGAGMLVNSQGVEVLASAKSIPVADWFVAVSLPAREAFALLHAVQARMMIATLLLSAFATGLTWLLLRRQLAPLMVAAQSLHQQSTSRSALRALPVESDDEIGALIKGFNGLLQVLDARDTELRIAAAAFESQEGIFVTDARWAILKVNRAFTAMTGYSSEEAIGRLPQELLSSNLQDPVMYELMSQRLESEGVWQGEVWDRRKTGEVFPLWLMLTALRDEAGTVTHYVVTMLDITERKAAETEIRNLAFYDALTGLPNRRLLMDRLSQALAHSARHKRSGALLFLDLDNFKDLNDTLGHDKGDQLLKQVAQRLQLCVREGDTVARLGGDEFVVMLQDLSEEPSAAASQVEFVGEKVLQTLNQPYLLTDTTHRSTSSVGVTMFGDKAEKPDDLLKRADLAMYQAKAAGRNTLRFFDVQMQTTVTQRASMEAALREAVERHQFLLYYQPQVDADGRITGAESLVRWQHPERGMVFPGEFVALAEHTGLILPMGQWILESACQQIAKWAHQPGLQKLSVSVNVSALQLMQVDFVARVLQALEQSGADPHRLKLELTESVLVSDVAKTIDKMLVLKARGVGFSLDDFGTGYSSLAFLKLLPLDQLKIDQSFVRDILVDSNDAAIAKMVIALGASLNLMVIAEGVETQEQRAYLAQNGCFAYQGYLFGRPMPADAFETLVASSQLLCADSG
jgi:diguanylate cyclase (GGDEF)-like protein/PAS domain S-box-containing protein